MSEKMGDYEKVATLAVVNYKCLWGNKSANLEKIKNIAATAAGQGNNIIAFPELALSGCEPSLEGNLYADCAETIPGPATDEIARLTGEKDVYVVFGMPERDKDNPDIIYNSSVLIGPEGFIGVYRKLHLSPPPLFAETRYFTSGNALPVFATRYGLVGIQICRDFWLFPELTRILALKGARLIINTTASPDGPDRPYYARQQTGCRATENLVFAASSNMVGTEQNIAYYGHSCIAGPDIPRMVTIFAEGGEAEEIVSATLNFERLNIFHEQRAWDNEDYRLDVIVREIQAARQR